MFMSRHTFIVWSDFKQSGLRCQCQVCLNIDSQRQNKADGFPFGRKQITQETEMRFNAWLFVYTQGVTYPFLWAVIPPYTLDFFLEKRQAGGQRPKYKNVLLESAVHPGFVCSGWVGEGWGEGLEWCGDLEQNPFPSPCPPLCQSYSGQSGQLSEAYINERNWAVISPLISFECCQTTNAPPPWAPNLV